MIDFKAKADELALTRKKKETLDEIEKLENEIWGKDGHRDQIEFLEHEMIRTSIAADRARDAHNELARKVSDNMRDREKKMAKIGELSREYTRCDLALVRMKR